MMKAIITGASRGMGRAIAEKFIKEGYTIAITARRETELQEAASALRQLNPQAAVYAAAFDLSVREEAQAFGAFALQHLGQVDVLINNTGTYFPGELGSEEEGLLEKLMGINLYSAYHLTRHILSAMKGNEAIQGSRGHIINISSIAALKAYANGGAYSVSKFAMQGFSKNLREELMPYGIKVSTINPGATWTDSWNGSGVDPQRILQTADIAGIVWSITQLSPQAVVEDIVIRPLLGDL